MARARGWLEHMRTQRDFIVVPYPVAYEVRRGLLAVPSFKGIEALDAILESCEAILPDRLTWDKAAELWAESRLSGRPTGSEERLEVDALVCATVFGIGPSALLLTSNRRHMEALGVESASIEDWPPRRPSLVG